MMSGCTESSVPTIDEIKGLVGKSAGTPKHKT